LLDHLGSGAGDRELVADGKVSWHQQPLGGADVAVAGPAVARSVDPLRFLLPEHLTVVNV